MDTIKRYLAQYPDRVTKNDYLELAKKNEKGVPMSTGVHIVTLLKCENATRDTEYRGEEKGINLIVDEDGVEKKYFVPMFVTDKNSPNYGKFHYLFQKFEDIEEDTMLEMEFVRKGARGYVDVRIHDVGNNIKDNKADTNDIPVIEETKDGHYKGEVRGVTPSVQARRTEGVKFPKENLEKEIDVRDIPF
ncbi:MAG: hypothetical protein NT155_03580 [Candidatus Staskawiczbacteria bacterium]|nr:hypothetical protein [Candidatus Staskawiczbacteria bacterium]